MGLTVTSVANSVTVTASASPVTVASGGKTTLTMTAMDSLGHTGLAYQWSDNGAGGTFSPSATVQKPTYTAAVNNTGARGKVTLTATATDAWQSPWVSGSAAATLTVNPLPHTLKVTASAAPTTISSGGTTASTAVATDSQGHTGFTWAWSDGGAGGTFSPSAQVQNPVYKGPGNTGTTNAVRTLTVTATCSALSVPVSASANVSVFEAPASTSRGGSGRLPIRRQLQDPAASVVFSR